jgi:hypothetical protein
MQRGLIATALLMYLTVSTAPQLSAQAPTNVPAAASQQTIPDLSGVWDTPYNLTRNDICGEPNCRALGNFTIPQPNIPVDKPVLKPWAEAKYKALREGVRDPNALLPLDATPWFSACVPMGPTILMSVPFVTMELRQFPGLVLLFFTGTAGEGDHTVRRIYLDGRSHPSGRKPSAMGHSIGRYDGDTLVVDTIGISDKSWLDLQGYPQSDALHLVERFHRLSQKELEYEVMIEDPKAYQNSWRRRSVRHLSPGSNKFWEATDCEELLRMGTHYGAETGQ